jgi:hypothetical protein
MPLMYMQNSLQMEWCLDCHRNPAKNLRPTSEIYNMAWAGASSDRPVWCAPTGKPGATAQSLSCVTKDPSAGGPQVAMLQIGLGSSRGLPEPHSGTDLQPVPRTGTGKTASDVEPGAGLTLPASYQKFTSQEDLGKYLTAKYHIRPPNELTSCETCHR